MYKRNAQGWSKHLDFFIIELIALQAAFAIAGWIRLDHFPYIEEIYRNLAVILTLSDIVLMMLLNTMHNVIHRSWHAELFATVKHCFFVFLIAILYTFAFHLGDLYSRLVFFYMLLLHIGIGYLTRMLWKAFIRHHGTPGAKKETMLVVLDPDNAVETMGRLLAYSNEGFQPIAIVFSRDSEITEVSGVPVVSSIEDASAYVCREWIDAVYIDSASSDLRLRKFINDCREMAVPVHYRVPGAGSGKQLVEKIGGVTVLTSTINYATPLQALAKRVLDILGGIVGSLITLLIMAIVGPIIKIKSPGPILFKQERIGQNGKHFKMIKLRSMYMDAEERKKDLLKDNRVKDGMMFKLDWDPRIIGNKILPDGTKKTGIGDFIRRTSLDEFPQFFNVLIGQMSLVGTRPPTIDEWEKYEFHHRARLACKPGITGMWQVSGRSEITDFEEVVKLDTEYISNWSFGRDLQILFKTFSAVFFGKGAM